jgi:hypothetical protein
MSPMNSANNTAARNAINPVAGDVLVIVSLPKPAKLPVISNVNPWEIKMSSILVTNETMTAETVRPARWSK